MHSFLLVGIHPEVKIQQLLKQHGLTTPNPEKHPDIFYVPSQSSILIKTIRELKSWIATKPYQSPTKAIVIIDAHVATLPAQNALLKTLEEPPRDTIIILTTPNQNLLLETILSRCQIIQETITAEAAVVNTEIAALITLLSSLSPGERISRAGECTKSHDGTIKFTEQVISLLRQGYYPSQAHSRVISSAHHLRLSLETLKRLKANVNPKLVLENMFLNW